MTFIKHLNTKAIVLLCYLLTCVTGIVNIIPMVIKKDAATSLHVATYQIGYVLSFYMLGMLIGSLFNGNLLKRLTVKQDIILFSAVYLVCCILLYLSDNLFFIGILVILMGVVGGVTLTLPYMLVVHAFHGKVRSSTLNRVDLMYSVGAFIAPPIAGAMLNAHFSWQSVFAAVLLLFAIITFLVFNIKLPNINKPTYPGCQKSPFSKWNSNIYLISFAMFCYVASYMGLNYWLIHYATDVLHVKLATAILGESAFWWFYAVGCFVSSFIVRIIELHKYMLFSSALAIISYFSLMFTHSAHFFIIAVSLLGFACSTLYSSSLSYGTHQIPNPSPRVVSFLVAVTTAGTLISELLSSFMVHHFGLRSVVDLSTVLMIVYVLFFVITLKRGGTCYHYVTNNA